MVQSHRICLLMATVSLCVASVDGSSELLIAYGVDGPLTLHEPVVLQRQLSNATREEVEIYLGRNSLGGLTFSLMRPSGVTKVVRPGDPPPSGGAFTNNSLRLKAGETYPQTILLNDWFEFREVGTYRLDIQFGTQAHTTSGRNVVLPAPTTITFAVLPRNEQQLRESCAMWLNRLTTATNSMDSGRAARALASVDDPISIEFLREVIKSDRGVYPIAIDALARMRTPEAISLLEEATADRRPDVAEFAATRVAYVRKSGKK